MDTSWPEQFAAFLDEQMNDADAAHDRAHIRRVVTAARALAEREGADLDVVEPAAWLHDCVAMAKDDPERDQASRRAAEVAVRFLKRIGYPEETHEAIHHAIEAHSYSAGIVPETTEARVVQDADRLDAIGAIGIARCFMVGGALESELYNVDDPFCEDRKPDDHTYTIDHFYEKLLGLPETMQTQAGRKEAERRADVMRDYLNDLRREITGVSNPEL
ncbi:hydrolase [Longibacter salinarum]|uniref:Hydrolase n=1 Tax=Longibacter salinarum TaxID=1850348 RepID=A0A2A8CUM5_9BACT|nr:HD domain-containing protein [Longibacter salinarum]PEN12249.1 hydrolase [Longibacter salinarum]